MQKPLNAQSKYDLIVDGGLFYGTCRERDFAEKHAKRIGGYVRDYFVAIVRYNPNDRRDVEWRKEEGFSVWADPDHPPFDPVADSVDKLAMSVDALGRATFGRRWDSPLF